MLQLQLENKNGPFEGPSGCCAIEKDYRTRDPGPRRL